MDEAEEELEEIDTVNGKTTIRCTLLMHYQLQKVTNEALILKIIILRRHEHHLLENNKKTLEIKTKL